MEPLRLTAGSPAPRPRPPRPGQLAVDSLPPLARRLRLGGRCATPCPPNAGNRGRALKLLKGIGVGLQRRKVRGTTIAFGVVGAAWTITEVLNFSSDTLKAQLAAHHVIFLVAVILLAALTFLIAAYEPHKVSFRVPTTNTLVELTFGNLLNEAGDIVVAVNECFDFQLGPVVAPTSLHGQLITTRFQSDESAFRQAVDQALTGKSPSSVQRAVGNPHRYEIGTTALLSMGASHAYLVALTHTDPITHKATADVTDLWTALDGLWKEVRIRSNNRALSVPLIGGGPSGVNLAPQHLLRLLVLSLVTNARQRVITSQVRFVLPEACFDVLDLREIARDWRKA